MVWPSNGTLLMVYGNGTLLMVYGNGTLLMVYGNGTLLMVYTAHGVAQQLYTAHMVQDIERSKRAVHMVQQV
eukprot:1161174-Pelagomonas_calceolata.AAC.10